MWPWDFLGIGPTQDPKLIKRAYVKLLRIHNPQTDTHGFRELRNAYEAALSGYYYEEPEDFSAEFRPTRGDSDDNTEHEIAWQRHLRASAEAFPVDSLLDLSHNMEINEAKETSAQQVGGEPGSNVLTGSDEHAAAPSTIKTDDQSTQAVFDSQIATDRLARRCEELFYAEPYRRDVEPWLSILDDTALDNLDVRWALGDRLIEIFNAEPNARIDSYGRLRLLPTGIIERLDRMFGWTQNELSLVRRFPVDWIDRLMNAVRTAGRGMKGEPAQSQHESPYESPWTSSPSTRAPDTKRPLWLWLILLFLIIAIIRAITSSYKPSPTGRDFPNKDGIHEQLKSRMQNPNRER